MEKRVRLQPLQKIIWELPLEESQFPSITFHLALAKMLLSAGCQSQEVQACREDVVSLPVRDRGVCRPPPAWA